MAVSPEILGLVSLGALFVGIFAGFPISFTLIFLAIVFGYIGFGKVVFYLMVLQTFIIMREPLLAAVPLFLFMGYILEQAGLMDRLFSGFRMMLRVGEGLAVHRGADHGDAVCRGDGHRGRLGHHPWR